MPKQVKIVVLQQDDDESTKIDESDITVPEGEDVVVSEPEAETTDMDKSWTYWDSLNYDKNGNTYDSFNLQGMLFWNYYVTYLSLFNHVIIHAFFLGWWCSSSKIVMFYSFQVFLVHAYSWAIPDRRYAQWIQNSRNWFYLISGANIIFFLCGIFGGVYLYNTSRDGMVQFMGVSFVAYTFFSQIFMMIMFSVNYRTLRTRFAYQENGYHGHVDYPKKSQDQQESPQVKQTDRLLDGHAMI